MSSMEGEQLRDRLIEPANVQQKIHRIFSQAREKLEQLKNRIKLLEDRVAVLEARAK